MTLTEDKFKSVAEEISRNYFYQDIFPENKIKVMTDILRKHASQDGIIDDQQTIQNLLVWARSRWSAEVEHRPDVNTHKRTLDETWKQVIAHLELCLTVQPPESDTGQFLTRFGGDGFGSRIVSGFNAACEAYADWYGADRTSEEWVDAYEYAQDKDNWNFCADGEICDLEPRKEEDGFADIRRITLPTPPAKEGKA